LRESRLIEFHFDDIAAEYKDPVELVFEVLQERHRANSEVGKCIAPRVMTCALRIA
jgi:hypothetical protein